MANKRKKLNTSLLLIEVALLVIFALMIILFSRSMLIPGIFCGIILILMFVELFLYKRQFKMLNNQIDSIRSEILREAENYDVQPLSADANGMISIHDIVEQIERRIQSENENLMLSQQAQLLALQNQINPHFLYNCLETVRGEMITRGNMDIAEMVEKMAKFYRYNISRKGNLVELADELNNIENYIAIQKYRFDERIKFEIKYHNKGREALDCLVPKLLLQPLVENSILHGLDPKVEGGTITIHVDATDKHIILTISDDGVGMTKEQLNRLRERIRTSGESDNSAERSGIAIININSRLKALWGDDYVMSICSTENNGTDIELTMPILEKNQQGSL